MDFLRQLIGGLEKQYSGLGVRELENGARLIGHVPHVAPEAYLHSVFPGLDPQGIKRLESDIEHKLPGSLKTFYAQHNGLDLFAGSLSIFGLRDPFMEGEAGEVGQPFSMATPNVDERPADADDNIVFLGFYDWDGSLLYATPTSPKIFRCSRESAEPLNTWPNLEAALTAEIKRLGELFDKDGAKRDEDAPTAPEPLT
jgi:hypothetical protein